MLCDYIDIQFNALESARIANQIQTIYLILYCPMYTMKEILTFKTLLSRRFIVEKLIMLMSSV